jgi:hypothetical protein
MKQPSNIRRRGLRYRVTFTFAGVPYRGHAREPGDPRAGAATQTQAPMLAGNPLRGLSHYSRLRRTAVHPHARKAGS